MKKYLLFLLVISSMFRVSLLLAYGPFSLPIHNNSVQINGGAWYYSENCIATRDHGGFDFDGDEGDDIYSASAGVVVTVKNSDCPNTCQSGGWGCYVDIKHDINGDGVYDYTTKYAHLKQGSIKVSMGDKVGTNTKIAEMGNTGNSCGAHLHFGIQNYGAAQYLDNDYWLDPYNLYGDATCCAIPNGCPYEGSSSQHPQYNCGNATSSKYLWSSCPPKWEEQVNEFTSISTAYTTSFSTYNTRNARVNKCSGAKEYPGCQLSQSTNSVHWWGYSTGTTPSKSTHWRDDGKYTTLQIQDYSGGCSGAIVFDDWGGANRAYIVQCEHWTAWLTRNGPQGESSQSYPQDCGAPITNVYGYGSKWIQDFQDCRITYRPDDGTCIGNAVLKVLPYPKDYAPGEMADGSWSTTLSYRFAEQYELKGASKRFGYPITGILYNSSRNDYYQHFRRGRTLYYNPAEGRVRIIKTSQYQAAGTLGVSALGDQATLEETTLDQESLYDLAEETNRPLPTLLMYYPSSGTWYTSTSTGNSLPPATFLMSNWFVQSPTEHWYQPYLADYDGDAMDELLIYTPSGIWFTLHNDTQQWYASQQTFESSFGGPSDTYRPYSGDFNGDTRDDVLLYATFGAFYVRLSSGTGLLWTDLNWLPGAAIQNTPESDIRILISDPTGDGMDDVILYQQSHPNAIWSVGISTGSGFNLSPWLTGLGYQTVNEDWYHPLTGDINGDGFDDIGVATAAGAWYMALSTGNSFTPQTTWYDGAYAQDTDQFFLQDMNGDGMSDAITYTPAAGTWNVGLSTGTHFSPPIQWATDVGTDGTGSLGVQVFFMQFN